MLIRIILQNRDYCSTLPPESQIYLSGSASAFFSPVSKQNCKEINLARKTDATAITYNTKYCYFGGASLLRIRFASYLTLSVKYIPMQNKCKCTMAQIGVVHIWRKKIPFLTHIHNVYGLMSTKRPALGWPKWQKSTGSSGTSGFPIIFT